MDDGQHICNEFLLWAVETPCQGVFTVIENHEFASCTLTDPLNKLEPEPHKSVAVGNHKALDIACENSVQNGKEPSPPKVKPGTNV
jgi:hypothetical protein